MADWMSVCSGCYSVKQIALCACLHFLQHPLPSFKIQILSHFATLRSAMPNRCFLFVCIDLFVKRNSAVVLDMLVISTNVCVASML